MGPSNYLLEKIPPQYTLATVIIAKPEILAMLVIVLSHACASGVGKSVSLRMFWQARWRWLSQCLSLACWMAFFWCLSA